jgi:N-acetylmuramoyl-L-alanine amidase
MLEIQRLMIKENFTKDKNVPEYIVIHDTGNRQFTADAIQHYKYFQVYRGASAHFFVDDDDLVQLIEVKDSSWHCGDGNNKNGINNRNTISIEICINKDSNYKTTIANTIDLVVKLMRDHNIPLSKVVRHYDASGKNCPQTMNNNGNWSSWIEFKRRIEEEYSKSDIPKWKLNVMEEGFKNKLFTDHDGWIKKIDEPIQVWTVVAMLNNYIRSK